jgi:hypothetical protein
LAGTGDRHQLFMSNYGRVGKIIYELWTPKTKKLVEKLANLRGLQPNITTYAPDKYSQQYLQQGH